MVQDSLSTPYNASNPGTMPNIGYVFSGYDIFYGNPLTVSGLPVDPGFRQPIFQASYGNNATTADQRYLQPDGTFIRGCSGSCSLSFGSIEMSGLKKYQQSLERKVSLSVEGYGAKFSASLDYKEVKEGTESSHCLYTHADVSCCAYIVELLAFAPPPLSANFRAAVGTLSDTYDEKTYMRVIQYFGTHFISQALMGGLYGQQSKITSSSWTKMESMGLDISAGASYSAWGVSAAASVMSKDQKEKAEEFSSSSSEQLLYSLGAAPPEDGKALTWAQDTIKSPMPINLKLTPIIEIMDGLYGIEVTAKVKSNFQKALDDYCSILQEKRLVGSCSAVGPDPPFPTAPTPPPTPLPRKWTEWLAHNTAGTANPKKVCGEGQLCYVNEVGDPVQF